MSTELRIQTLGGLTIERDGQAISAFDSRKVQALLVYLACNRRAYPRDVLAEFFWEERTQSQALANLRVALTSLRQTVEPFVDITRDSVALRPDSTVWLDASAFEAQLDAAGSDAGKLSDGLALYQGDFLSGFYVDSTAFEDWATRERERLKLRALDALDTLARCHLGQQDAAAGIASANRLLTLDPLREETHRLLMELLWHAGQRGKALEQYETLRNMLQDELGIEPAGETTVLYERIRAGESPVPATDLQAVRGYDLRERIGAGGFGEVYRAFQPVINREVAIKVIKPAFANHPDFIRRFETEGQLIARLEHPHIVPLYDYWREPGGAFLVMRLLRHSLADRLAQGPLSVSECTRLVEQVSAALTVAHRAGVVHRDVKPANILLDEEGNAYLTDFGIAKVLGPALKATQEGALVGSPVYLSPEQIKSEPVSSSADIYSFGVLLFEALTGQLPFADTLTPSQILYQQLNAPLPSVLDAIPDLPAALDTVLQRATAKDPAQRFRDALALASAFRQAAGAAGLRPSVAVAAALQSRERPDERPWTPADSLVLARNPYKGLRAFEVADASDFFGREALVEYLLGCLANDEEHARFLAVVGPSGSGKSSVVKAGLIPALRDGQLPGAENWFIAELQPGPRPLDRLEVALLRVAATQPPSLMEQLLRDAHGLTRAAEWILPPDSTLLLVIDQFEELFTLAEEPRLARHLLALLEAAALDPRGQVRVLLTLRADFYDRPLMVPGFCDLIRQRTEVVVPLTAEELERAISLPAEQVGIRLEPGLAAAMTADVYEQPGALPLLQFALTELFEQRTDHTLTLDAYRALGGVEGALAQQATRVFERLDANEQNTARQLFLRLVTLGEGSEDTRRRALQSELLAVGGDEQAMQPVIDVFDRARLLTFDHDPVTHGPTVEVAHEALLREWGQLREWLDDSRHDIRQQRLLAVAAQEWQKAGQDKSYLLTGSRLAEFEGWANASSVAMTPDEQVFLEASNAEYQRQVELERQRQTRELELQKRAANRLRYLVAGLAVFLAAAVGLTALAFDQRNSAQKAQSAAEREAALNHSLVLASKAEQQYEGGKTDLALALALEAVNVPDPPADARQALTQLAFSPGTRSILDMHNDWTYALAFSPDGQLVASGSCATEWTGDWQSNAVFCPQGELFLWRVADGEVIRTFPVGEGAVCSVAFSPDGSTLVSGAGRCYVPFPADHDRTGKMDMVLWDVSTGEAIHRFSGHTKWVESVAFSPDGTIIASGSGDGMLRLWDARTGQEIQQFGPHPGLVHHVTFHPDGKRLFSVSENHVFVWDIETGNEISKVDNGANQVLSLALNPNGQTYLTSVEGGSIYLWDANTNDQIDSEFLNTPVDYIAISPDGRTALLSNQSRLILWDIGAWQAAFSTLQDEYGGSGAVAISPDGMTGIFAPYQKVHMLNLTSPGELRRIAPGGPVTVALTPDGERIITGSIDGTLAVWDRASGEVLKEIPGNEGQVFSIAISPDGHQALVAAWDYFFGTNSTSVILWDLDTGALVRRFEVVQNMARAVAFTPDGASALVGTHCWGIAIECQRGELVLFDVASGDVIRSFAFEDVAVASIAISADGNQAFTGSAAPPRTTLWDMTTGQPIRHFDGHTEVVGDVAFGPDEQTVLGASSDSTVIIWNRNTGDILRRLQGHRQEIWDMDVSPDGQLIVTASLDGTVRLWDYATGSALRTFDNHGFAAWHVVFSADGQRAYSAGGRSGPFVEWDVTVPTLDELVEWAYENRLVRAFTCEERAQFGIEPLCE